MNELVKKTGTLEINEFKKIMNDAPAILESNKKRVENCILAGQALIKEIEKSGGIKDEDTYEKARVFIEKTKLTLKVINEERTPITSLLQAVAKEFTSLEAQIDPKKETIPNQIQKLRDEYAELKILEQRRKEEEAKIKLAKEKELIEYKEKMTVSINTAFSGYSMSKVDDMMRLYDHVSIESYDNTIKEISEISEILNWKEFGTCIEDNIMTIYMTEEQKKNIKIKLFKSIKESLEKEYKERINGYKKDVLDRMPSKLKALQEERELAKKNKEAAMKAEAERKRIEEEERKKREEEIKEQERIAAEKAKMEAAAAEAIASFNAISNIASESSVKAKVKKAIKVVNPQGFLEVYQMWFLKEGKDLSMDKLEKIHKSMITFCNKEANKDGGEMIKSKFVEYVDDIKAK